jgi:hypothetical protein
LAAQALIGLRADLTKFVDGLDDELRHVAGLAAKEAALDAAEKDLGADRTFSGFRRKSAQLRAGYDLTPAGVTLNLTPKGLWNLANDGRRPGTGKAVGGKVFPRKGRGGSKALNTPWGPRANVKTSRSRALGTLADAEEDVERETFKAVDKAVAQRIVRF